MRVNGDTEPRRRPEKPCLLYVGEAVAVASGPRWAAVDFPRHAKRGRVGVRSSE